MKANQSLNLDVQVKTLSQENDKLKGFMVVLKILLILGTKYLWDWLSKEYENIVWVDENVFLRDWEKI